MEENINAFIESLVDEGKSKNTVAAYQTDLNMFAEYLKCEGIDDIADVNEVRLNSYLLYLEQECQPSTLARKTSAIKSLFKYLDRKRVITSDIGYTIKVPKVSASAKPVLSAEEREALYNAVKGDSSKDMRDRAIISLLIDTKIKVSELVGIKFKDVNLVASYVLVTRYNKENAIEIDGRVKDDVYKYLKQIPDMDTESYLFISNKDKPFTRQGVWKMVKSYGKKAGIDKEINPEMLRRQA